MIGVVLWSNTKLRQALFWCEDHGDIAVFDAGSSDAEDVPFFDAGDMVQFDVATTEKRRTARNPRLVAEKAFQGLAEALVGYKPEDGGGLAPANIIPFPGRGTVCPAETFMHAAG